MILCPWNLREASRAVRVGVPTRSQLTLGGFRANPTRGDRVVTFSLPDAGSAQLELFDVAGRKVASREVGVLGEGSHFVTLQDTQKLAPGVYVLRLSQGTRSIMARAVVLQ